jgi:hypothetical protein
MCTRAVATGRHKDSGPRGSPAEILRVPRLIGARGAGDAFETDQGTIRSNGEQPLERNRLRQAGSATNDNTSTADGGLQAFGWTHGGRRPLRIA